MFSGTSSLYFLRPATRLGMGSGSHFFVISSVRFDRVSGRRFPDRVCITREWSLIALLSVWMLSCIYLALMVFFNE